ncbi:MAG: class I SAM-dependent methyltransferase [Gammaproteobacteria bacterium]|nr:class I SAM-dependent methyltransferase [Gammaproteobacteria bacterium]
MSEPRAPQEANVDRATVEGFGREWTSFDQRALSESELRRIFADYFAVFPFDALPPDAVGFDLGCGSGRWARLAAERVGHLHCVDASAAALDVARVMLAARDNVSLHHAAVDALPFADGSMDFGYSLGVLHHVPDTAAGIASCVAKLKPGAPFLVYLYYAFDQRPAWFRALWRASDVLRRLLSRAPYPLRYAASQALALSVYWPLARGAAWLERRGLAVEGLPLSAYRDKSFYTMRTDALDRFGTRLEQRFTRAQISTMMAAAGLTDIRFHDGPPYWCAVGYKRRDASPSP